MTNFAIIETGGKQYKVAAGDKLKIEKLEGAINSEVSFDKILLLVDGDSIEVGTPYLKGKIVTAKISDQGRDKKKLIFKYHSKTRLRRRKGHRQHFTEVTVATI